MALMFLAHFKSLMFSEVELTRYLGARTEWHIKGKSKGHQWIYEKCQPIRTK
jgi:hypothetical protein